MKSLPFFILLVLLSGCTPPSPQLESVLHLAPPEAVHIECDSDSCNISWQASAHSEEGNFAGYKVYVSKKSLLFSSPTELPIPIIVDKGQTSIMIAKPEPVAFVHIRSFTIDNKLSLPSLPELKVEN